MVYLGICWRYELALTVATDKDAFAAFQQDERIKALPRPPQKPSDTLRTLFVATYADPKKASKYFKRVQKLWAKNRPMDRDSAFLKNRGLSDPPPKPVPAPPPARARGVTARKGRPASRNGTPAEASEPPLIDTNEPPGDGILGWPGTPKIGRTYKLTVKVLDCECDCTTIELLEIPELLT